MTANEYRTADVKPLGVYAVDWQGKLVRVSGCLPQLVSGMVILNPDSKTDRMPVIPTQEVYIISDVSNL